MIKNFKVGEIEIINDLPESINYECQMCGKCCFQRGIPIYYSEINRIYDYLKKNIDSEKFNNTDWDARDLQKGECWKMEDGSKICYLGKTEVASGKIKDKNFKVKE